VGKGSKNNVHRTQTHAITHAPVTSLRSQDEEGYPLPTTRNAEGPLPYARRGQG
jgi:hypothetical protein